MGFEIKNHSRLSGNLESAPSCHVPEGQIVGDAVQARPELPLVGFGTSLALSLASKRLGKGLGPAWSAANPPFAQVPWKKKQ